MGNSSHYAGTSHVWFTNQIYPLVIISSNDIWRLKTLNVEPQTTDGLKGFISNETATIPETMSMRMLSNFKLRLQ